MATSATVMITSIKKSHIDIHPPYAVRADRFWQSMHNGIP